MTKHERYYRCIFMLNILGGCDIFEPFTIYNLCFLSPAAALLPLCTAAHQTSRPWDSPGKNTGVGCHFLLQCMKVKSESEVAHSCLTPCSDCSLPGSSVLGIF